MWQTYGTYIYLQLTNYYSNIGKLCYTFVILLCIRLLLKLIILLYTMQRFYQVQGRGIIIII